MSSTAFPSAHPVLVDSLRTRWQETEDPDERVGVGRHLILGAMHLGAREEIEAWMDSLRPELGDSATLLAGRLSWGRRTGSLTEEELDELLPYLDDPGRLWALGVTPRWTYSRLAAELLDDTPILQPDTTAWSCSPAACERVIALLETAAEPRLRDVALVAAFSRDPARWYERLRARADSGSLIVGEALRLGEGIASPGSTPGDPPPPPGSNWREWLAWAGGNSRPGPSHAHALRLYAARAERDVVSELRRAWPPEGDSARAVMGSLLRALHLIEPPTLEQVARELLSGSMTRVDDARSELGRVLTTSRSIRASPPDSLLAPAELVTQVVPPLLDSLLSLGRSPWPGVGSEGTIEASVGLAMGGFHGIGGVPRFLMDENVPADYAPGNGFSLIAPEDWDARPLREGGILMRISPVSAAGPFVALSWEWTALRRRGPDQAPSGFAGGGSVWLLLTDDGWIVVTGRGWIT